MAGASKARISTVWVTQKFSKTTRTSKITHKARDAVSSSDSHLRFLSLVVEAPEVLLLVSLGGREIFGLAAMMRNVSHECSWQYELQAETD